MSNYLTPVGGTPKTPEESPTKKHDISTLGLRLDQLIFYKKNTSRPCIVVHVEPRSSEIALNEPPCITIVLITGFSGKSLNEVLIEEEFNRVMPIAPTAAQQGTADPISTTPAWLPHSNRKVPSYVLLVPLKVYSQNLRSFEEPIYLDDQNLEKLKLHLVNLGGLRANEDFVDMEEDDDDECFEVSEELVNRIVTWVDVIF